MKDRNSISIAGALGINVLAGGEWCEIFYGYVFKTISAEGFEPRRIIVTDWKNNEDLVDALIKRGF